MLNVPQEIKDLLHRDTCPKNIRIHFPNGERTDICNNLIVKDSVSFKESLCSQDTLKFGLTEAAVFECEVVGVENIKGVTIEIFCEIYCDATVDGAIWQTDLERYVYQISYGEFLVDESKRQADMQHRKIVAYGGTAQAGNGLGRVETIKQNYGEASNPNYVANAFKLAVGNLEIESVSEDIFLIEDVPPRRETGVGSVVNISWSTSYPYHSFNCRAGAVNDFWDWGSSLGRPVADANNLFIIELEHSDYYEFYEEAKKELQDVLDEYGYTGDIPISFTYATLMPMIQVSYYNVQKGLVFYMYKGNNNMVYNVYIPKYFRIELYEDNVLIYSKNMDYVSHHALKRATPQNLAILDDLTLTPEVYTQAGRYKIKWQDDFNNREILNGLLEICGLFGGMARDNKFNAINIKQKFGLTPSSSLYPGSNVHPQSVTGGTLVPNDYQKCWYDDDYTKPFGAIQCAYKNTNNEDTLLTYFLPGYSLASDISTYKIYDLSNNYIIKGNKWTQTQIEAMCATIANNIEGVTYMPVEFTGRGLPYVEAGDTFEVLTRSNDSITTIVLNRTLTGEQTLTDNYKSV